MIAVDVKAGQNLDLQCFDDGGAALGGEGIGRTDRELILLGQRTEWQEQGKAAQPKCFGRRQRHRARSGSL